MNMVNHTTGILLVFLSDNQLQTIEYIYIGCVVCHTGWQLYKQKAIPWFIKSTEDYLEKARLKWKAGKSSGVACFFSMFVTNFCGLMVVPIEPLYCLVYPNIYATSVPPEEGTISTSRVALPGYTPASASAVPCFSMLTCLRPQAEIPL